MLLPTHVSTRFEVEDFAKIYEQWYLWIWLFRGHIFGQVIAVIALVALGTQLSKSDSVVILIPGIVVLSVGLVVLSLGSAFYFGHGTVGSAALDGKSTEEIVAFIQSIDTESVYASCIVRF